MPESQERPRPTFELNGQTYPLIWPSEFDLGEIVDAENGFGASFAAGADLDGRKIAAIIFVSMRRVDPRITTAAIRTLGPAELEHVQAALVAGQDADPNPSTPVGQDSGSLSSTHGLSDEPATDSVSDLSDTGDPSSGTSSDSARPTFVA